ncbi:MAG: ribonuclease III [bacterium]
MPFRDLALLKLALTHRSYLSVTGMGPRESNERLEFLGDSVLGLVTSEFLYRRHPDEHEGHLTKVKSLLVSKAILSRRALRMGLGRFVLMSHSEVESGGRQRLSILADAFESVLGAIYLDQGFEAARTFIHKHLLSESDAISSDKRHTNYKSHLQEYVQTTFRTHPSYRIRSEVGPDHSKYFMVEVMVGRRTLGEGRGHNKKEAEQAAARDALEKVERMRRSVREDEGRDEDGDEAPVARPEPRESRRESRRERDGRTESPRHAAPPPVAREPEPVEDEDESDERESDAAAGEDGGRRRRRRRGGRRRGGRDEAAGTPSVASGPPDEDEDEAVLEEWRDLVGEDASDEDMAELEALEPAPEVVPPPPAPVAPAPVVPAPPRPAPAAAAPAAPAFGRGRRRVTPAAPVAPSGPVPGPVADESRAVDPFAAEPEPSAPPVVDVPDAEPERESPEDAAAREARIAEMERAYDSFGRRGAAGSGRRGRRR